MAWLYVALGGAAGALLRYAAGLWLGAPRHVSFPWATFGVNVAGSLVLGMVVALVPLDDRRHLLPLLAVGFCGGLTTFSTFSLETLAMLQARAYGLAGAYVGASLAVALAAVWAGMELGARRAGA
ncbi:MAG TPA: fluoride efflux transporter CrcB [Longimicrobium sp.]|nr:fluoride efflux transporter CrcB [Longimicrobium sp.]